MIRKTVALPALLALLVLPALASPTVDYTLSLAQARNHVLRVRVHLTGTSAQRDLRLPVWNALYQVRDFAQYILRVSAKDGAGRPLPVRKVDTSTWRISNAEAGAEVEYDVLADQPGPYGAHVNGTHAFLNLALVLMYPVDARDAAMTVTVTDLPSDWKIATALPGMKGNVFTARNYDRLVDGPMEIGPFEETAFEESGARYRIVVDANRADYDLTTIAGTVRKIVATGVWWMNDRPFTEYLFLYHFPHGPGGGGMEHAYSTAIDVSADFLKERPLNFASLTAHEFFHLWNVKRIRPRSLDPVDYTRENPTTALWFAEGVTSTVADLFLLRARLMTEKEYLEELTNEIRTLELRPAHLMQSVEEASLDAWLEKYSQYRTRERSISYYNKGRILGVLMDLEVRERTQGRKSLRDVLQWMNLNYANQAKHYPDSDGVRAAMEAVAGTDFGNFFRAYVSGVDELAYNEVFRTVGLRLERRKVTVLHPGFTSVRNFDTPPVVVAVDQGSDAERTGLAAGDTILTINGKPAAGEVEDHLRGMVAGDTLRLRVTGRKGSREVKIRVTGRDEESFAIVDLPQVTPLQRARRNAWLNSEIEP
ncbi:MAG: M61 family metallopeptidase [Terriglobales bacterium]